MKQAAIKFAANSSPGERSQLSGARLINAIVEKLGTEQVIVKRAPGLKKYSTSIGSFSHCRGIVEVNDTTALIVYNEYVERVSISTGSPVHTIMGLLPGSDLVTVAKNNAATPDIVCVSPISGPYVLSTTGAPSGYPDADVEFPNSVCFLDGYFFFSYRTGKCIASGLNTTATNPLDFAIMESNSGGMYRVVAFNESLYMCGPDGMEQWVNNANPTGFPFSRSAVIPSGIAGTYAIAGFESGFTKSLLYVGTTNMVYQLNGVTPVRISTHDVERDIQNLADKSTIRCFVAMNNGHAFWVMKSPEWTWVYDLLTSSWQERQSYGSTTWRAEMSARVFGDWLLGDGENGKLYRLDNMTYAEDTLPLVYDVTSLPVDEFPQRQTVARADFALAPGTGQADGATDQVIDPSAWISWSDDSGATYGTPVERKIGQQGAYARRIYINRCGRTKALGRQWNIKVSDPVYAGIQGGVMQDTVQAMF